MWATAQGREERCAAVETSDGSARMEQKTVDTAVESERNQQKLVPGQLDW